MPALRERRADLPMLVQHLLHAAGKEALFTQFFPPATLTRWQSTRGPATYANRGIATQHHRARTNAILDDAVVAPRQDAMAAVLDTSTALPRTARRVQRRWLARLLTRTGGKVRMASRGESNAASH